MTDILAKHKAAHLAGATYQGSVAPSLFDAGKGVMAPDNPAGFNTKHGAMTLFAHERTVLEERAAQDIRRGKGIQVNPKFTKIETVSS